MKSNKKPTYKELEDEISKLRSHSSTQKEKRKSQPGSTQNIEHSLSEHDQKFRLLFENMPSAFVYAKVIYENDKAIDFEYIEVNYAFTKLTGLKNVVGKRESGVVSRIHGLDSSMLETVNRVVKTGIPEHLEYYVNSLDTWFYAKIYSPHKGYFISIVDDITARKRLEEDENYLNKFISNIGDPIFVKDDQSRLLIVNDAFCEIFGLTRDHIIGKTLAEDVSPNERESFLKIDKQVIRNGVESVNEESLTVREGQTRRISTRKTRFINSGGKKFLVGVIHDITERYKAENELKAAKERAEENEERFRILMLNMDAGVVIHASDTSIMQNNNRASEILGLSDDQLKGKTAIDPDWRFIKLDKSPLPLAEYPVNRIASSKKSIKNQLVGLYQPSKEDAVWLTVNGFPVLSNTGEITEIVTIFIDITDQKLFEEAQVKHDRLKAIGEMSSSIAHDFNNALQEMMGNLEVVKLQKDLSKSSIERLNNIATIITDAAGRVSALQKFGDTENDDKNAKLIDFNKLIEENLIQSRPLWKDSMEKQGLRIKITTDFKEIPKIRCNRGELKSVIYNLIKNCIEAMPEGGDLIIKTGIKAERVFATFTDTGIGMDAEAKLKVFEPFFTTKGFQLGRGLGMSGAYSIIKKYGGDIGVKSSELDKGTTIEIAFPIGHPDEIKVLSENKAKDKDSFSVLWVDDDFIITKSSRMMVESLGYKCKSVNSGKNALEYLTKNTCDIVFTDIGMPKMNGWELADAIRKKYGNKIKIVAVTGWNIDEKVKKARGIDFIMQKPFTLVDLENIFLIV